VRAALANIGYLDTAFRKARKYGLFLAFSLQMRVDNQRAAA
jgi:hypothetical protein